MPGLVPGIHVLAMLQQGKTWMAGTSPAMTLRVTTVSMDQAIVSTMPPSTRSAAPLVAEASREQT